jgi:hypothetical protein
MKNLLIMLYCIGALCGTQMVKGETSVGAHSTDPMFDAKVQHAGVISVSGIIVDRNGVALTGVDVKVRLRVANEEAKIFETQNLRSTSDGTFHFEHRKRMDIMRKQKHSLL